MAGAWTALVRLLSDFRSTNRNGQSFADSEKANKARNYAPGEGGCGLGVWPRAGACVGAGAGAGATGAGAAGAGAAAAGLCAPGLGEVSLKPGELTSP